jgi:hypothetical protein
VSAELILSLSGARPEPPLFRFDWAVERVGESLVAVIWAFLLQGQLSACTLWVRGDRRTRRPASRD